MVADAAAWRTWLNGNHAKSQGVRLVLAKKGTTHPTTLSYDEALDEAICFGWPEARPFTQKVHANQLAQHHGTEGPERPDGNWIFTEPPERPAHSPSITSFADERLDSVERHWSGRRLR